MNNPECQIVLREKIIGIVHLFTCMPEFYQLRMVIQEANFFVSMIIRNEKIAHLSTVRVQKNF